MSELLSIVVPLQTLPGWPTAENPTSLEVLGLLIGYPALAFVIVVAIAKIGNMVKGNRGDSGMADSLWVGGRETEGRELEQSPAGGAERKGERGGAGARW